MTEIQNTYRALAAPFKVHHKDPRGLEYLTGEQVISRLNEVLGPGGWSYIVAEHGYESEADELWALGRLSATIDGVAVVREQFGSQKHNRRRSDSNILDHGFDLKGAATDALKKCATLLGVGLYLAEKEGGVPQEAEPKPAAGTRAKAAPAEDADVIKSADDSLWQRWRVVRDEAMGLDIPVRELTLPMSRTELKAYGSDIALKISARKKEAATA